MVHWSSGGVRPELYTNSNKNLVSGRALHMKARRIISIPTYKGVIAARPASVGSVKVGATSVLTVTVTATPAAVRAELSFVCKLVVVSPFIVVWRLVAAVLLVPM